MYVYVEIEERTRRKILLETTCPEHVKALDAKGGYGKLLLEGGEVASNEEELECVMPVCHQTTLAQGMKKIDSSAEVSSINTNEGRIPLITDKCGKSS